MAQPSYLHDKRHGVLSNEQNIRKARRGLPYITPLDTKHPNLWETDTDASTNRFFRSYVFGQRELHQLLGRPHGFEANAVGGKQGDSMYELETDQRWKGLATPMMAHVHWEPEKNVPLYPQDAHVHAAQRRTVWERAQETAALRGVGKVGSGGAREDEDDATKEGSETALVAVSSSERSTSAPRALSTEELLGPALVQIRDAKSIEHCQAWFERLAYLIQLHYDAVGDVGEFKSRHTQHVHEFFVHFHDAISSFDFQDAYLWQCFQKARPAALNDLFGIFIEMEAHYVHPEYCPRCSLPFATTRYCGEGDADTPFRRHRGRWASHPHWGKEWWEVVCRRAEALWYRATEDPYFGHPRHTQRQVEAMLQVYIATHQRGKAINFLHRLRGSLEYLTGEVRLTDAMTTAFDAFLDRTPHPHLLTNGFALQHGGSSGGGGPGGYTGAVQKVPHSPLQMVLDMKKEVFRRQQREEGVVRIPPASWRLATDAIVPYAVDSHTKKITNWREVQKGMEKAFLDSGLPREAYTEEEWRWVCYWRQKVANKGKTHARWEAERRAEVAAAQEADHQHPQPSQEDHTTTASPSALALSNPVVRPSWIVFPTAHWYQVFDISADALAPFASALWKGASATPARTLSPGLVCVMAVKSLLHPDAVSFQDTARSQHWGVFNTTAVACQPFGGYEVGEVLCIAVPHPKKEEKEKEEKTTAAAFTSVEVVVIGVRTGSGSNSRSTTSTTSTTRVGEGDRPQLYAMYLDPMWHTEKGLLSLGSTAEEVSRTIHPEGKEEEEIMVDHDHHHHHQPPPLFHASGPCPVAFEAVGTSRVARPGAVSGRLPCCPKGSPGRSGGANCWRASRAIVRSMALSPQ